MDSRPPYYTVPMMKATDLEIITLSENTVSGRDLVGEWGLSFYVRHGDSAFLFDTGAGSSVSANASVLNVGLGTVDKILLSHGHYDHTGGIPYALQAIGKDSMPVYGHPDIFTRKYSLKKKDRYSFAGIPWAVEELERLGAEFHLSAEPVWFGNDIVLSGEEPMNTSYETVSDKLLIKTGDGHYVHDEMKDDQSLFLATDLGLVILLGCAHRGMINIIRYAVELTGLDRIHMVVGGTHLVAAPDEQIDATIEALRELGVDWVGVSHCTGGYAGARLAAAFGDKFFFNNAGTRITFPFKRRA